MNIDFHVHGLLSKRKDFNAMYFISEIQYAKRNNLDGFVLCEHFNARAFKDIHKFLSDNYLYHDGKYEIDGFSIFPGIEVSIKNKGHVILISEREQILDIYDMLLPHQTKETLIEFSELLDIADERNCIKIGAHPCRKGHKLCDHPVELLSRLDGLDFNGKDIFKKGESMAFEEVSNLSKIIVKNVVTGSDSHTPLQLGSVYTSFDNEINNLLELKNAIYQGEYSIKISESLQFQIFSSKVLKRYLISTRTYDENTNFIL